MCVCYLPSRPLLMSVNAGFRESRQLMCLMGIFTACRHFFFSNILVFNAPEEIQGRNMRLCRTLNFERLCLDIFNIRLFTSRSKLLLFYNLDFPPCSTNEYQCFDKSCVDASHRCDGKKDCFDNSDEDGCGNNIFMWLWKRHLISSYYTPLMLRASPSEVSRLITELYMLTAVFYV